MIPPGLLDLLFFSIQLVNLLRKPLVKDYNSSQCQLEGLKQYSTTNARIALTYFICTGWVKNNITSTLAFDIAQFFLSLNHQLLLLIFDKARFNPKILLFL